MINYGLLKSPEQFVAALQALERRIEALEREVRVLRSKVDG